MDEKEQVLQIPLDELHEFRKHTFQVRNDEAMKKLVESVKESGLLTPILVFRNEDGEFEVISGHRRLKAAKQAGMTIVPAVLKRVGREDAILLMGDSNFTCRESILPSEKAFTYKAMLDSIRKKHGDDGTVSFRQELADHIGESTTQLHRYLRLTELIDELLCLVDAGKLSFQSAVEISFLDRESQKELFSIYQETGLKPSLATAKRLHALMDAGELEPEQIRGILEEQVEEKKKEEYKLVFYSPALCSLLADCVSVSDREDRILYGLKLVEQQRKAQEERYAARQQEEMERIRQLIEKGGGDTYGG